MQAFEELTLKDFDIWFELTWRIDIERLWHLVWANLFLSIFTCLK